VVDVDQEIVLEPERLAEYASAIFGCHLDHPELTRRAGCGAMKGRQRSPTTKDADLQELYAIDDNGIDNHSR
jgi:hypothetical protein